MKESFNFETFIHLDLAQRYPAKHSREHGNQVQPSRIPPQQVIPLKYNLHLMWARSSEGVNERELSRRPGNQGWQVATVYGGCQSQASNSRTGIVKQPTLKKASLSTSTSLTPENSNQALEYTEIPGSLQD